jgi:hypothetical protein
MSKDIFKVLGIQLGIFVSYQLAAHYLVRSLHRNEFVSINANILALHWAVLMVLTIVCFAKKKNEKGTGYLVSLFITLIVGFGSCTSLVFANNSTGMSREELQVLDSVRTMDSLAADAIQKAAADSLSHIHDSIKK